MSDFPNSPSTEEFWYCSYGGFHPPVKPEYWDMFMSVFEGIPQQLSDSEYKMIFGEDRLLIG